MRGARAATIPHAVPRNKESLLSKFWIGDLAHQETASPTHELCVQSIEPGTRKSARLHERAFALRPAQLRFTANE